MELNGFQVFAGGCMGFIMLEAFKFGQYHISGHSFAAKYKKLPYWIGFICLCLVSGFVTIMNGVSKVPLERAIQLGLAAPAILSGLATSYKVEKEKKRISLNANPDQSIQANKPSFLNDIFTSFAWL